MSGAATDVSDATVGLVCEFEGFSAAPYLDPVGKPTIGYGSIWDRRLPGCPRVTMQTPPVTEPVARSWVHAELLGAAQAIAADVKVPLSDNQRSALEDFVYNLGRGNLEHGGPGGGPSTLLRLLNAGDYHGAAAEFEKWDHAGGKELAGLLRRRKAEAKLFSG